MHALVTRDQARTWLRECGCGSSLEAGNVAALRESMHSGAFIPPSLEDGALEAIHLQLDHEGKTVGQIVNGHHRLQAIATSGLDSVLVSLIVDVFSRAPETHALWRRPRAPIASAQPPAPAPVLAAEPAPVALPVAPAGLSPALFAHARNALGSAYSFEGKTSREVEDDLIRAGRRFLGR